jgi:hypothetical protein
MMKIHIGELLHSYFEEKRIRRAALARLMDMNLRSVLLYEQKESIKTDRLLEICVHLKHNFFADIAQHLPEHYTKTQPEVTALHEKITALEHQNELLTTQLNLLKELMRKD